MLRLLLDSHLRSHPRQAHEHYLGIWQPLNVSLKTMNYLIAVEEGGALLHKRADNARAAWLG